MHTFAFTLIHLIELHDKKRNSLPFISEYAEFRSYVILRAIRKVKRV
jgi:hypothetical protein